MSERRLGLAISIGLLVGLTLMPVAAGAAQQTAEPAMLNMSWWWEDYQGEEIDIQGNKVIVETPNPLCPSTPGSTGAVPGTCAEGRIPVEIRGGDYETPVMLAGVGFDLSYLTPGSEVTSFTVTFLEAEAGCYDGPDEDKECQPNNPPGNGDHVEQTNPKNIEGKKLQACLLPEIIGDAEARPYAEVPRYTCSETDPVAERKEIKAIEDPDAPEDADGVDHIWTFDLTPFAQQWAEKFSVSTAIMLTGNKPADTGPQDSWSVVLAGAKAFKGIRTKLVYEPAALTGFPPPGGTTDPGTGGTTTGGFTTGSTGSGSFGVPSSGGTTTGGSTDPGVAQPGASPSAAPGQPTLAGDELEPQGMPGYVLLALLAGFIGFILVRQAVVESTSGIRPDGVLAKIHALNAERRGVDVHDVEESGGIGTALAVIGRTIASPFSKLPFFRKG